MKTRSLRYAVLLLLFAGSVWGLCHIEYAALLDVLRKAPPSLLALGVVCNFINLCGKASSWYFLLPKRPSYARLLRYSVAGGAFSVVAPLRAGEGLRIWLLAEREGIAAEQSVGVALTEKMLNVLGIVALVLPLPWLVPNLPTWLPGAVASCVAAIVGMGVAMLLADRLVPKARWPRTHAALGGLRQQGWQLVPAFLCLLVGWLGDCALAALMLHACGLAVSPLVVPFVLFVINLAIVVPSTPAQVGTLEFAAVGALQALGVAHEPALAFALLYHAVQILPLLAVVLLEAPLLRDAARRMAK